MTINHMKDDLLTYHNNLHKLTCSGILNLPRTRPPIIVMEGLSMAISLHGMEWYNQLNGMVQPMEWNGTTNGMEWFIQWNGTIQSMNGKVQSMEWNSSTNGMKWFNPWYGML